MLPVSPCVASLFYQRSSLVYQSPSALSGAREEWEGWREEELQRERKTERCCRQVFRTTPSPHRRLWLLLSSLPLCLTSLHSFFHFSLFFLPSNFSSWKCLALLCAGPPLQHVSLLSLNNSNSWSHNNISLIHQAQPALINKHFESTPQHRTELKMSPLCLCQYLSLCWQSYIRLRGGWLLQ